MPRAIIDVRDLDSQRRRIDHPSESAASHDEPVMTHHGCRHCGATFIDLDVLVPAYLTYRIARAGLDGQTFAYVQSAEEDLLWDQWSETVYSCLSCAASAPTLDELCVTRALRLGTVVGLPDGSTGPIEATYVGAERQFAMAVIGGRTYDPQELDLLDVGELPIIEDRARCED